MTIRQTWFVTGAASRLGADIVRQALAAGHRVVAADADPLAVLQRAGDIAHARLLALRLDEVDTRETSAAVKCMAGAYATAARLPRRYPSIEMMVMLGRLVKR